MEYDVKVVLELMDTMDGGRRHGVESGYRPHWKLGDYLTSGTITLISSKTLLPGHKAECLVKFISPEHYPKSVSVGDSISEQEGGMIIGKAMIMLIFNSWLNK